MNCEVIKDLIPLYLDGCCSEESKRVVQEHIKSCESCKTTMDEMSRPLHIDRDTEKTVPFTKLNDWKASVLQSVLLFLSFAMITVGVALESKTPSGIQNGVWACNLIVPSTGFMLSLANWYFVKLYKNRMVFTVCSLLVTAFITFCAYVWSYFHYRTDLFEAGLSGQCGIGIILSVIFCALSLLLSNRFAKMMGKE